MSVLELFERGGPIMWVLLVSSFIGAGYFVERLLALRSKRILKPGMVKILLKHLNSDDVDGAKQLCREDESVFGGVCEAGFQRLPRGRQAVKECMEEQGSVEVGALHQGVAVVSTVAAISPLLGLLGTVTGMIQVFRDVADTATPDIAVLASGIWQALITTGAGLTIAIPFFVAYRWLEGRIDRHQQDLEVNSLLVLDAMMECSDAGPAEPATPAA